MRARRPDWFYGSHGSVSAKMYRKIEADAYMDELETERDEAVALLREATNSKTGMTKDCYARCLAFLTRMDGA